MIADGLAVKILLGEPPVSVMYPNRCWVIQFSRRIKRHEVEFP